MIDPKSLRIGNLVIHDKIFVGILAIKKDSVTMPNMINGYNIGDISKPIDQLEGIPLSATVLEKSGFTKDGFNCWNYDVYRKFGHFKTLRFSGDYLYLTEGKEDDKRRDDDLIVIWNKDIMKEFYLHQLQNLYYSLTGRDLDIKL